MNNRTAKSIAHLITECFKRGNKLLICGNGGSMAMANHMEEEFICKFEHQRRPLPAISLKAHSSTSNDFGYEYVFARQVWALGKVGDILLTMSTSGKSNNVLIAEEAAKDLGIDVIRLPIKGETTAKIQEYQFVLMHDICREVEKHFIR